ncbi:hypothetical protein BGZ80_001695 [Entomortierella chlamydospora]|uniref:FAD-binding domain-containing protein n=1 Tax=Entomortierella chlamydospora TaxID=101097 RepID=A0A9P6MQV3_9FUNG|nr:hypothetical protein BGZ79_002087 [Entomortierella chlamydospora]KAG0010190.1 hypothetical protein BGZ80_001695 [Entomortierella chlamydospora]
MENIYPSQPPPISPDGKTPHVMIVGAGLAGLFLAILLDRINVPYEIYERSELVRPLGGIMSLNANILPALEQLGLLDELKKISLPSRDFNIYTGKMEKIAVLGGDDTFAEAIGYDIHMFSRPKFYALLLSHVPAGKIHYKKKVMSIAHNKEGAMIRCSDGTTYHGDILVGADGAYSGIRQNLYKSLQGNGQLPDSDTKALSKCNICMVGTTDPLDPEKFPGLSDTTAVLYQMIGEGTPYTWSSMSVPNNQICWNAVKQLESGESEDERFRNSEWGPESNEAMIKEIRDFRVPTGTLGDLIDATPKDSISRVFLEDKLFETWNHGRVVLIGDACHKLLPSSGQGAVNALQDSVILANCIYELRSTAEDDIAEALREFKEQRYPHVKGQYVASQMSAKLLYGQTFFERLVRKVVLNYLPKSIQQKSMFKDLAYRPQASFLPQVPKRGINDVLPQKPSKRYQEEQKLAETPKLI